MKKLTFAQIDWLILATEDNKALLISEKILAKMQYNKDLTATTWKTCTLRKYLNGEFYDSLGNDKTAILATKNDNFSNPWFGTYGGNATTDKIFLLSLQEIVQYFGDSGQLTKNWRLTGDVSEWYFDDKFNENRIAKNAKGSPVWWWLRSPGCNGDVAAIVFMDGGVCVGNNGGSVSKFGGVRPALWLDLRQITDSDNPPTEK